MLSVLISGFVLTRRKYIDKLGILHAIQTSFCLDQQSEIRLKLVAKNFFMSSSKIIFTDCSKTVFLWGIVFAICVSCLSCCFICSLQPCHQRGKGLTTWLSCVWCFLVFYVTLPLVFWVRSSTWLNRFLIFALFLNLNHCKRLYLLTFNGFENGQVDLLCFMFWFGIQVLSITYQSSNDYLPFTSEWICIKLKRITDNTRIARSFLYHLSYVSIRVLIIQNIRKKAILW